MGSHTMEQEELLRGLSSSVPSLDLNQLIQHHGLDQWPGYVTTASSESSQSGDVVYTTSLNLTEENESEIKNDTEPILENGNSFSINVVIEQRMVRFRYDSELNNRNFGKEVLAKIFVEGFGGRVKIRIHAVDDKKMKAHPFCLIGDKCSNGVYIEDFKISPERNECICKATPRIPKQKDYEYELGLRRTTMNDVKTFPFITPEMAKDEYWTSNKSIKESKEILLMVEVVFYGEDGSALHYDSKLSEPINNAKDGKKFEVHAISPTSSSVLGSSNDPHFIILTADSYSPNEQDIEVRFSDDGSWTCKAQHVKVIKNAIEFYFPGYCDALSMEKNVYVSVYDKKKKLHTTKKPLILRPTDDDIIQHKRKKAFSFSNFMDNVKTEEKPSCSSSTPRKKHQLKRRGGPTTANSPLDLERLENEGMISLNIESPLSVSGVSQSSQSSFNQQTPFSEANNPATSLSGTIPNTIPAILIPSGSRDMEIKATVFGTPMPTAETTLQNQQTLNNIVISQNSQQESTLFNQATSINVTESSQNTFLNLITSESNQNAYSSSLNTVNNVFDISQLQTPSIGSLNSGNVVQEILRFLQQQQGNPLPVILDQLSQAQTRSSDNDLHNIQLEDLIDDFDQNDVEVDCADVTSTTETIEGCKDCGKEDEKQGKKEEIHRKNEVKHGKKEGKQEKKDEKDSKSETKKSDTVIESHKTLADTKDSASNKTHDLSDTNIGPEKGTSKDPSVEKKAVIQSDIVTSNVNSDVEEG